MEVEFEAPSDFLCPISMQLMKDPVTISTGITYDRKSIEKWLFTCRNSSCPVTKQPLSVTDLTPNHTLRRLIQSWCTMNGLVFDPIPSPKKPIDRSNIVNLIHDAKRHPENQIKCLRRLRSIVQASDQNMTTCMEDSGVFEFLTTVIVNEHDSGSFTEACYDALTVFHHLQCTDFQLRKLVHNEESGFINALLHVLRIGSIQSRMHSITLLKSLFKVADPVQIATIDHKLFNETVRILKECASVSVSVSVPVPISVSQQAIKASLELIVEIIRWGRNRIKAAESGLVSVLIDLLIENSDRRGYELMLVALEQICRCAEGRAALLEHAAGIATVSKKILRVSHLASDRAVRILCLVCRFCANFRVLQEMLEVGVVSKMCLLIQVDCSERTKERVKQILTLHSRVWKDASCIPTHLLSSYPSLD